MATDDHGLGIPVPDEFTEPIELNVLIRDSLNTTARLIAAQQQRIDELQRLATPGRLLGSFAQQLTDLQQKHEAERLARIAADADLRSNLTADFKLALLERGN